MMTEGKYRHTYAATASDITPLYRLTPNALLKYFQDSFARLLTMPDEVLASQTLTSVIVHWLHETYLDETLTCHMSHIDDGSYLHTLTNAEGVVVCELMSRWQPQP